MNKVQLINDNITDPVIGEDAWSDVFLYQTIDIANELFALNDGEKLWDMVNSFEGHHKQRLVQVLLSVRAESEFDRFILLLPKSDFDTCVLIFDHLRFAALNQMQAHILISEYQSFKGKDKLLDYVMNDFISKTVSKGFG
jgi:hypothetical protein